MTDPFVGKLTFFRVYSGSVSTGDFIYNPNSGKILYGLVREDGTVTLGAS